MNEYLQSFENAKKCSPNNIKKTWILTLLIQKLEQYLYRIISNSEVESFWKKTQCTEFLVPTGDSNVEWCKTPRWQVAMATKFCTVAINICGIWRLEGRASWYILIINANEMHCFSTLFWPRTLHVSDRFSVHHQEYYSCICSNRYFVILVTLTVSLRDHPDLASRQSTKLVSQSTYCCKYSTKTPDDGQ